MKKLKIFLIMPVRNITRDEKVTIHQYVSNLEAKGHEVYYPLRDTDQENDDVGIRICGDNVRAMWEADAIHVWWKDTSQGSVFDMGATLALIMFVSEKKIVIANASDVQPTKHKSFVNILIALSKGERPPRSTEPAFSMISRHS